MGLAIEWWKVNGGYSQACLVETGFVLRIIRWLGGQQLLLIEANYRNHANKIVLCEYLSWTIQVE